MLIAAICGILTALFWGVGEYWTARVSDEIGPIATLVAVNSLIAALFGIYYYISPPTLSPDFAHHTSGVLYAIAAGVLIAAGDVGAYKAYAVGPVSLVSPLASIYPLVTVLLAIGAYKAHLSSVQMVSIGVVIVGVVVASGLLNGKKDEPSSRRGPYMAIFGAVTWGIAFAFLAQASMQLGWETAVMIEFIAVAVAAILMAKYVKGRETITFATIMAAANNKFMRGAAIAQMGGYVAIAISGAGGATNVSIASAISACYPVITVVLALRHWKDKPSALRLAGALSGVAGVFVLTLTSAS